MVYEENGKYFRKCDDCKKVKEISRPSFIVYGRKEVNLCRSCKQSGNRNCAYNKKPWNYGLTKETDERVAAYNLAQSKTKKGRVPWNKGLTKEDPRVLKNSLNIAISKKGVPNLKNRKAIHKDQPLEYFKKLLASFLYSSWKRPILERDNFTCQNCGSTKNLEVHHIIPFRKIVLITCEELSLILDNYNNWSEESMLIFKESLLKNHKLENGITYCSLCHDKFDFYRKTKKEGK